MGDDDRFDRMEARLAALEEENRDLRSRLDGRPSAPGPPARIGRRDAVKTGLGLAGAAATGAVLIDAGPAAAAVGQPVLQGEINTANGLTLLRNTTSTSIVLDVEGPGPAIVAASSGSIGIITGGTVAHLALSRSATRTAPQQDAVSHARGQVVLDGSGVAWLCVGDGTPGTWRSLGGPSAVGPNAGAFTVLPTPVRAYDSRPGTPPAVGSKTPLAPNTSRVVDLKVPGTGVDATTTTVVLNLLLVNTTAGSGNATVWRAGAAKPQANSIVYGGNAGRFSTVVVSAVDTAGRVQVHSTLQTHVVIDVVGLYR